MAGILLGEKQMKLAFKKLQTHLVQHGLVKICGQTPRLHFLNQTKVRILNVKYWVTWPCNVLWEGKATAKGYFRYTSWPTDVCWCGKYICPLEEYNLAAILPSFSWEHFYCAKQEEILWNFILWIRLADGLNVAAGRVQEIGVVFSLTVNIKT